VGYWILAVLSLFAGILVMLNALAFPQAVAEDPVPATATVTRVTRGVEGEPSYDYRYRVGGRTYTGGDSGQLIGNTRRDVRRGDKVQIQYAWADPSQSCTCDAAGSPFRNTTRMAGLAAVLALPLAVLIFREGRRAPKRRRSLA
jgi:hypothetical protein